MLFRSEQVAHHLPQARCVADADPGGGLHAELDPLPAGLEQQVELANDVAGEPLELHLLQVKHHPARFALRQIKKIVEESAQSYEHPEEVIRWYYAQPQRLQEVEGVAIEDNVVAWALSASKVVEKPIAFDELMGHKA